MEIDKAIKRLAFIKYLYSVGVEESRRAEPFCWASILTFHDAIELFLALASEFLDLDIRLRDIKFMEYWSLLNPILQEKGKGALTQKMAMEKLNKARVDFKHYGNPPSKSSIEDFRASATNFFEENTSIVFNVDFSDISLIELVECETARRSLEEAQEKINENKIEDSLDKVALAFAHLIDDYESRKRDEYGRSPFSLDKPLGFDDVTRSIEAFQDAVKILSLGLDYRRYAKFKLLTPIVLRIPGGNYQIQRVRQNIKTKEDVQFCIDFVIESAIALQEFDFEVKPRRRRSLADLYR